MQTLPGTSCPVFPADNPWNQRVDTLPVAKDSAALIAQIGLTNPVHPDFGTVYNGAPNGIPYAVGEQRDQARAGQLPVRLGVRRPPLPAAAQRPDRGRAALQRRPPRDRRQQGHVHRLRAVRRLSAQRRRAMEGGLGRDLQPALGQAAARGLDVGRRRRACPSWPAWPATARRRRARSATPCASPRRAPSRHYVYPARHEAGSCGNDAPPMGLRVRLKASVEHLPPPPPGPDRRPGAQDLRDDPGRQRQPVVHLGGTEPALERRRAPPARPAQRRDFQVVDTSSLPHPGR